MVELLGKSMASKSSRRHAFVAGWSRRNARSLSLLLGVRSGGRGKLTYVGAARVHPRALFINLLERRLRQSEIEASPFRHQAAADPDSNPHWVVPELVAEIEFEGWTKEGKLSRPKLCVIEERRLLRRPRWLKAPKKV
jgi:ATP-dependent DNA ligase